MNHSVLQDVQYAFRVLFRHLVFTIAAILLLALVIGTNTILFSIIDALLLRPLPFHDASRMVAVWERPPRGVQWNRQMLPFQDFLDLQKTTHSFDQLEASAARRYNLNDNEGHPASVIGEVATGGYFNMLGVAPSQGHTLSPGNEHVSEAVLSDSLWRGHFGAQNVLGKTIDLNGRAFTIVGVMPPDFSFPSLENFGDPEIWTVLAPNDQDFGGEPARVAVVGVLRPSVDMRAAESEVTALLRAAHDRVPLTYRPQGMMIKGLLRDRAQDIQPVLTVITWAVALVFLIACTNVVGLLLGRATERKQEIAVRFSLGARRFRIMRQLLIESLVLWSLGGVAGLLLAAAGLRIMLSSGLLALRDFPHLNSIEMDWRVALYSIALTFVSGAVFGFLPAWMQSSRGDSGTVLREASRTVAAGRRLNYLRRLFIVSELAISTMLLLAAGLLLVSLVRIVSQPLGFQPANILTFRLALPKTVQPGAQRANFFERVLAGLRGIPSLDGAGASSSLPLVRGTVTAPFSISGRPTPPDEQRIAAREAQSPDYFRVMGIPLIAGRRFDERDTATSKPVVIINKTFAHRYFPHQNPIGQQIKNGTDNSTSPWLTVVGVVGDYKHVKLDWEYLPEMFFPIKQVPPDYSLLTAEMYFAVHGPSSAALSANIRTVISSLDKNIPVAKVRTMDEVVADTKLLPQLNIVVMGIIGGLSVVLAVAGLYGILSQFVSQRRQEIGIRTAIGATPNEILAMVLREGVIITLIGVLVGLPGGLALMRLMRALLTGITTSDPWVFVSVSVLMFVVAIVASLLPAFRALSLDPVQTLRYE
jgi:putative ABC transport system permease protein